MAPFEKCFRKLNVVRQTSLWRNTALPRARPTPPVPQMHDVTCMCRKREKKDITALGSTTPHHCIRNLRQLSNDKQVSNEVCHVHWAAPTRVPNLS